jgi:hypothetical protein
VALAAGFLFVSFLSPAGFLAAGEEGAVLVGFFSPSLLFPEAAGAAGFLSPSFFSPSFFSAGLFSLSGFLAAGAAGFLSPAGLRQM